ncbi:mitoribosomal protein mL71 [Leishmania donovani]|uniref:Uncharacterized protein n=3 Tax=Leishmania donovani species complex TaxID=38574 RepID=A4I006_LEIIN|nr:conserved hypothetical protein [Leishmania infantum JPCM5]XP_003860878.1 hypothetical protein, conserved [Leishmania donovani]CAC9488496.1 hypothetical_protein_-_conserved [Leishmania infantum]AYU78846.1 hypothetical protein LdCL_220020300 [Leishmania donovani]TPP46938.1 hypothetical protein CGC21_2040 [Leishmania donovani]TPP54014.1 hypothetical protein CGC20_16130 [Leishmania donovani]CAJ1988848.1 mitoribosomal protein mL71 [Leishmania donovani]|eukprot:XP_001465647.1 conserved hypothetical protein [Leishmania infantum JPCM5]
MLRRQCVALSYQRGSWAPGSKHQKHMSLNPTMYLYRFAGPHGPGPYVMKYWWTLGCFPTGIERPFRLPEFLASYQQQHVPIEVEEWLQCFVKNPYEELKDATSSLLKCLEEVPIRENTRGYRSIESGVSSFAVPLAQFERQLNVRVPSLAVRAALGSPALRERLKDDLFEYNESLSACGSTPHRRLARLAFDERLTLPGAINNSDDSENLRGRISLPMSETIGSYASPNPNTSDDEKKLIRLLTTFSEGCALKEDYESAFSLLSSSLSFSHDDDIDAVVHSNASAAAILGGLYKDAEFHGRQAALLEPQAVPSRKSGGRGYVLWATATAYQEDFDRASRIVEKGLEVFPDNTDLKSIQEKLAGAVPAASSASPLSTRMVRSKGQQARALLHGSGRSFDNEFDWVVFKNKLYPSKMNPSSNEMGSVFRRVGDFGGHISTSRSLEPL